LAALAELRDPASLPAIIDRLESEDKQVALSARSTLLTLAGDDLGPSGDAGWIGGKRCSTGRVSSG